MVQIRDLKTYDPLPGVELGDIGPKFGYLAKDNGYMSLNNVRIPRTDMFRRFSEVDKDGNFLIKGDLRTLYSVMLFIRVTISVLAPKTLAQALVIATRYAAVRRQFSTQDETKIERRLIDYQTHQFKIIPLIASSYCMQQDD